ncbi:MAG: hypothetical protein MO853_10955 [Candidatus Protistobacter heckmanni]|nr:hypothetical protein [Candidatus Protistobacter heckmanni]
MARDLFGKVPVTRDECYQWVAAMAPNLDTERICAIYIRDYNITDKVAWAKLHGTFESAIDQAYARRHGLLRRLGLDR